MLSEMMPKGLSNTPQAAELGGETVRMAALDCLGLIAAVFLSRWLFRSHYLYMMDSVNFALGMEDFAPALHQPHPPGYFLYVLAGRLLQWLLPDPNDALVALSIIASAAATGLIYGLARLWFGRQAALFAGMLFLFSPLAWFHGTVALVYMPEAALAALAGLLCWLAYRDGKAQWVVPAAIVFALAIGVRQSLGLFLAPLWLCSLWRARWEVRLAAVSALLATVCGWFIPLIHETGGADGYFVPLHDLWERVPAAQGSAVSMVALRLLFITAAYGLCFGMAAPLPFLRGLKTPLPAGLKPFLFAWLVPGFAFFVLVFFHPMALGYLLFLLVPVFVLAGAKASTWFTVTPANPGTRWLAIALFAGVNIGIYLYAPVYASWQAVQSYGKDLAEMRKDIRALGNPKDTLVVAFDAHFYGFRHAGYYLPDYQVVEYPEIRMHNGMRTFGMQARRTRLYAALPTGQFSQFVVVCPDRCEGARAMLARHLPPGHLKLARVDGREYLTGPAAYLDRLFPATTQSGH